MIPMRLRLVVSALLVALTLWGCGAPRAGEHIIKKKKGYGSVVSLSPSTTMLVAEVGGSAFLSGRTESCDTPSYVKFLKVVVKGTKPDYEAIVSLRPDLIVYDRALYSDDEIAKIKELGVETMEYDPHTLDDYNDFVYKVGSKLAIEMAASRYLDKIATALTLSLSAAKDHPKVTILLGTREEGYYIMGTGGFHAEVLRLCGGTPVGVDGDRFAPANIERLIEMDPEVIYSDGNSAEIYSDPRLQNVLAVQKFHVYDSDPKYLTRMSSKIDTYFQRISRDLREKYIYKPGALKQ